MKPVVRLRRYVVLYALRCAGQVRAAFLLKHRLKLEKNLFWLNPSMQRALLEAPLPRPPAAPPSFRRPPAREPACLCAHSAREPALCRGRAGSRRRSPWAVVPAAQRRADGRTPAADPCRCASTASSSARTGCTRSSASSTRSPNSSHCRQARQYPPGTWSTPSEHSHSTETLRLSRIALRWVSAVGCSRAVGVRAGLTLDDALQPTDSGRTVHRSTHIGLGGAVGAGADRIGSAGVLCARVAADAEARAAGGRA
jgi:hypothetical protein